MQVKIKTTKIALSPEIKDYVQKKMDKLEKFLGAIPVENCDVDLEKIAGVQNSGNVFRAEVNLELPRALLSVEKTTNDLNKAIDKVEDHLAGMIKKYKEKMIAKKRGK